MFECFRCGICCVKFQAPLTLEEVGTISAFLKIRPDDFIHRFTDVRWLGKEKLLAPKNGACPFLLYNASGTITNCQIHKLRPAACRDWIPDAGRRECREGLTRCWQLSFNDSGEVVGGQKQIAEFQTFVKSLVNENKVNSHCKVRAIDTPDE